MNNTESKRGKKERKNDQQHDIRAFRYRAHIRKKRFKECFRGLCIDFRRHLNDVKFLIEASGILVLLVYTIFTGLMYFANKKSADAAASAAETANRSLKLTEALARGENAAWFFVDIVPSSIQSMDDIQRGIFVRFQNKGKVIASGFQSVVTLSVKATPDGGTLRSKTITSTREQLKPVSDNDAEIVIFNDMVTEEYIRVFDANRALIQLEALYSFDDGFGYIIHESTCKMYVVMYNAESGTVSGRNWVDCGIGPAILNQQTRDRKNREAKR